MKQSNIVFKNQIAAFLYDRGMLVFYAVFIAFSGIVVPLFFHEPASFLSSAAIFTTVFLKPILADSLAGEREHKTLETLLSSPIRGKSIITGKLKFCLSFALSFFGITVLLALLMSAISGSKIHFLLWQWACTALFAALCFYAISTVGVYISAVASDMRAANSRISRAAYPLGLIFTVYLTLLGVLEFLPTVIVSCALALVYFFIIAAYSVKIINMKQHSYFENLKAYKKNKSQSNSVFHTAPKTQLGTVLRFEFKYLMTLKLTLLNFLFLCFAPILLSVSVSLYFGGRVDLNFTVLTTVLMIPRVPVNLIAYSVGGEKVYKTGESLLSTPLSIRSVFLAKCLVPILISAAMLTVAFVVTLAGVSIIAAAAPDIAPLSGYNLEQLVLLFPASILSSTLMMFVSAILSVALKAPRKSLYVTSITSFLFLLPVLAIIYLSQNILIWSVIYSAVLLTVNLIIIGRINGKITRPEIVGRL